MFTLVTLSRIIIRLYETLYFFYIGGKNKVKSNIYIYKYIDTYIYSKILEGLYEILGRAETDPSPPSYTCVN